MPKTITALGMGLQRAVLWVHLPAAKLARAFCETPGGSCMLIQYDWLRQDVAGCDRMLYFSLCLQEPDASESIRIPALLHILNCQHKDFRVAQTGFGLQDMGTATSPQHSEGMWQIYSHLPSLTTEARPSNLSQKKDNYFAIQHYLLNDLGQLLISVRLLIKQTIRVWDSDICFKIVPEKLEPDFKTLPNCRKYGT